MAIETLIQDVLSPVCPRLFPDVAPANTLRPYATFQQIGGEIIAALGKEVPTSENALIQVNVWADTRLSATETMKLIEVSLIEGAAFTAKPVGARVSDYDNDMKRYCSRQDFSIWSDR